MNNDLQQKLAELEQARRDLKALNDTFRQNKAAFEAENEALNNKRALARDDVSALEEAVREMGVTLYEDNPEGGKRVFPGLTINELPGKWLYNLESALRTAVEHRLYDVLLLDTRVFEKLLDAGLFDHPAYAFACGRSPKTLTCKIATDLGKVLEKLETDA
jgi:hypothetical protein